MASIKVKFKVSTKNDQQGELIYQIIHNRIIRRISTKHKIDITEWNTERESIILTSNYIRNIELNIINEQLNNQINILKSIIITLEESGNSFTTDDIIQRFLSGATNISLFNFIHKLIDELRIEHKTRTIETYTTALNSFKRFRGGSDILLSDLDTYIIIEYERYLKERNISMNTISFYMRALRAIYNRAIEQELISNPRTIFKRVYTGIDKTTKRAISLQKIKEIQNIDISDNAKMSFARDLFIFSFYTRGMSFIDMAYLRKDNIKNGIITYRRRKTGQVLHIKWEKCMQDIIMRYPHNETEYILPIITKTGVNERKLYQYILSQVNAQLKALATLVSLNIPLTMYVARHSWASIARSKNIPISVISEGMGHNSEKTTQIYLASLDKTVVDKANSVILKLLK
ncbi:MAG: site-specific integrase [Bacteroidales bacterium]